MQMVKLHQCNNACITVRTYIRLYIPVADINTINDKSYTQEKGFTVFADVESFPYKINADIKL